MAEPGSEAAVTDALPSTGRVMIPDLDEIGAAATFDTELKVYVGSNIDLDADLVLDECEGSAKVLPRENRDAGGVPVKTLRSSRR